MEDEAPSVTSSEGAAAAEETTAEGTAVAAANPPMQIAEDARPQSIAPSVGSSSSAAASTVVATPVARITLAEVQSLRASGSLAAFLTERFIPAVLSGGFRLSSPATSDMVDENSKKQPAPLGSPLDVETIDALYAEIEATESEDMLDTLVSAASTALGTMLLIIRSMGDGEQVVVVSGLLVLLLCPLVVERITPEVLELVGSLCALAAALPLHARTVLASWFESNECDAPRFDRLVKGLQQFVSISILQADSFTDGEVQCVSDAVRLLAVLNAANDRNEKVEFSTFYNDAVNDELFNLDTPAGIGYVRAAYKAWIKDLAALKKKKEAAEGGGAASLAAAEDEDLPGKDWQPESIISYPFVLSPATKAMLLQQDARQQMRSGQQAEVFSAMLSGQMRIMPYLLLKVRRTHIVEDTMRQLAHQSPSELKKPLKVVFEGEQGIDEGGVAKEFMQVVTRELLDPQFAMFKVDEETRLLWFNPGTFEIGLEFELIGILIGVGIYNSIILDIPFPMVVYKRLKGGVAQQAPLTVQDLCEVDPRLGKSLGDMLAFEGDIAATFCASFEVAVEEWGEWKTHELVPGGSDIPVTNANVGEYVAGYVQWVLVDSIKAQFDAFASGFMKVCGGQALEMFQPKELELLVCGNPVLDFEALERATKYDDGFDESSQTIRFFWQALHAFDDDEKRLLLKFATGSDRAPINGLASLTFVISRMGPDCDSLPTSHTCFNHLLIPEYGTFEKLHEKLRCAIHQSEGFGLR